MVVSVSKNIISNLNIMASFMDHKPHMRVLIYLEITLVIAITSETIMSVKLSFRESMAMWSTNILNGGKQ